MDIGRYYYICLIGDIHENFNDRILPGIAIVSGQIFVCGGEVDSKILANGEVKTDQQK